MSALVTDCISPTESSCSGRKYAFPAGVRGWLHLDEGQALEELARDKLVLEIGTFAGLSTLCMARTARRIHTVDWHRGDAGTERYVGKLWTLPELAANVGKYDPDGKVVVHAGGADEVMGLMQTAQFDMAFIDGAHDYESVLRDINHALRLVKPGGILAFHDSFDEGVRAALRQLYPDTEPLGRAQSLSWYRHPLDAPINPWARVYVAVPAYGPIPPQTAASVYWGVRSDTCTVADWAFRMEGGSLLALTFNRHLCMALNQRQKRGWTHFCLHHADIECEHGWLDTMVEEMECVGADILAATMAIKDERGLTSCGKQEMSTGNVKRFTMKEIMELPVTFDAKAAGCKEGECLAVNTGVMLIDLRKPWLEEFEGFTIRDQITRTEDGKRVPLCMPEDWGLSLHAAKVGLRVFSTRVIRTTHHGGYGYRNDTCWGTWETEQGDQIPVE